MASGSSRPTKLPHAAGTAVESALPARQSLRAKGWMVTLAMLAYLGGAVLYIAFERSMIFDSVQTLERLSLHERSLALAEAAVGNAVNDVNEAVDGRRSEPVLGKDFRQTLEASLKILAELEHYDPGYARQQRAIQRSFGQLEAAPERANWIDLRNALTRTYDELEIRQRGLADQRDVLTLDYQRRYDAVTVESLLLAILGLVGFGSLAAWFFAGLTHDIQRLQDHALHIVRGRRGVALEVHREDELGRLMHAVNRMAADLDEREQQIQLDAQNRSHHDKMLAVGALAAGVAHEVNNPLAIISSLVQEMQAEQGSAQAGPSAENARQILQQVQRASHAARHLAEVAAPQPAELDWVDINGLLRQASQLMGYDRRYRRFDFDLQLDPALPAVRTSGDAIQQVLMQMMSLACNAVAASPGSPAQVQLITACGDEGVSIHVQFPSALDFTRSAAQRSMLLCRAIVEPLQGRLAFAQVDPPRQTIQLTLPVDLGVAGFPRMTMPADLGAEER